MFTAEIVSWNAKPEVTPQQMLGAIEAMLPDLKQLPGFIYQSAGQTESGRWVEIYYWDNADNAHKSNERMATKASLANLMELIEADSVTMEVIETAQQSSSLSITGHLQD